MSDSVLDLATGTITLDAVRVGPDLTRAAFLTSSLGAKREEGVENEPHHSWRVVADVRGRSFNVVLFFLDERLTMVELYFNEGGSSIRWADWSEE